MAEAWQAPRRRSGDEARADRGSCGDDVEGRQPPRDRRLDLDPDDPAGSRRRRRRGLDRVDQERPARHLRLRLRRRRPLAVGDGDGAAAGLEPAGVLDGARAGDHGRHRRRRAGDGAGTERRRARLQPPLAADRRPRQAERSGQRPQQEERLPRHVGEARRGDHAGGGQGVGRSRPCRDLGFRSSHRSSSR